MCRVTSATRMPIFNTLSIHLIKCRIQGIKGVVDVDHRIEFTYCRIARHSDNLH